MKSFIYILLILLILGCGPEEARNSSGKNEFSIDQQTCLTSVEWRMTSADTKKQCAVTIVDED